MKVYFKVMRTIFLIILCCNLFHGASAQNMFLDEKTYFEQSTMLLFILFYLNLLFVGIITFIAKRGKKLLTFLTLLLEIGFIFLIGINFGLLNLSISLLIINPLILFVVTILIVYDNKKIIAEQLTKHSII